MRILSNNSITREEIMKILSELDDKRNKLTLYLIVATFGSCVISVMSLVFAILK